MAMKLKFMDIFGEQIYAYFHPNKNGLCFHCKKILSVVRKTHAEAGKKCYLRSWNQSGTMVSVLIFTKYNKYNLPR